MIKKTRKRRVVVTGLGVVSSIGIGWQEFWKNCLAGKSGISPIESLDTTGYERHLGGEVKGFQPTKFMPKKKSEVLGRTSQLSVAASRLAIEDSKFTRDLGVSNRFGVYFGTTAGEIGLLEKYTDYSVKKFSKFDPESILVYPAGSISANIADFFKIKGPNTVLATACSSGNYAIGKAFDDIRKGRIDYSIAGGADCFSRLVFTGFARLYAIADKDCSPFDLNRRGMIPGEGAGALFLESLDSAIKRKAFIYAEVLGYGLSCSTNHMTIPASYGIASAIKKALEDTGVVVEDVDYISAHGTGTKENDREECLAFHDVFGDETNSIPISSIKSMLGHTMGAASVFEAIVCCLATMQDIIPPTINFKEKDPLCDIDCVPNKYRKARVNIALNNASAFGGNNSCLVIRKFR